ncbi:hypothetical protein PUNSTDRAFT_136086 [Punctularia strigosozonata HHB-11173 SS5]|uniref:uncharacterized protein n=1 Tax=Punctularia strigosozonata (strain HHB-11173) TaxID=741275 RepID=UPI0004416334|nr:uncharacterized protein PUNSTDRAFT_136086 [Punctularia strigosozonata HHB-11173 SS5]EIN07401.1 hypothetical protein PUNSTDRAFT_136086 [Punctularia strigosozonata HHB-11173 SS5]
MSAFLDSCQAAVELRISSVDVCEWVIPHLSIRRAISGEAASSENGSGFQFLPKLRRMRFHVQNNSVFAKHRLLADLKALMKLRNAPIARPLELEIATQSPLGVEEKSKLRDIVGRPDLLVYSNEDQWDAMHWDAVDEEGTPLRLGL